MIVLIKENEELLANFEFDKFNVISKNEKYFFYSRTFECYILIIDL